MAEPKSLADAAVDALAAVSRMDFGLDNEHAERHHVRSLKRIAEQHLELAFRAARELAWLAEDARREGQEKRNAQNV
jgi:hypothetical protein